MADLVDVKLIDGTARTVRELFTGRKYGLDYYQRESERQGKFVAESLRLQAYPGGDDIEPDL